MNPIQSASSNPGPGFHSPTFLFADAEGFTTLTEQVGDAAAAAYVERFHQVIHEAGAGHGGSGQLSSSLWGSHRKTPLNRGATVPRP